MELCILFGSKVTLQEFSRLDSNIPKETLNLFEKFVLLEVESAISSLLLHIADVVEVL